MSYRESIQKEAQALYMATVALLTPSQTADECQGWEQHGGGCVCEINRMFWVGLPANSPGSREDQAVGLQLRKVPANLQV